jgi:hypothetical protein
MSSYLVWEGAWRNEMRSHVTEIALAATLGTALIDAAPASPRHGQGSLMLATGHELLWPTANDARARRNYNYHRGLSQRSGYQWDPWGHWGSYYGPMIAVP